MVVKRRPRVPQAQRELGGLRCCRKCNTWLERNSDNFFNDADGPLGLSKDCKPCDRARQNERYRKIRKGEIYPKPNKRGMIADLEHNIFEERVAEYRLQSRRAPS